MRFNGLNVKQLGTKLFIMRFESESDIKRRKKQLAFEMYGDNVGVCNNENEFRIFSVCVD